MLQTGSEWLEWRRKGLGSSDAPIIMEVSPWKTPHELYLNKITPQTYAGKDDKELETNWAIEKGNCLEPIARAKYELLVGMSMSATCCTHKDLPYMRASLDGFNTENNRGLEIKAGGATDFEITRQGIVPIKYQFQLAHQFFVSGAEQIDFFYYYLDNESYKARQYDLGEYALIEVKPDLEMITKYVNKAMDFWQHVENREPPELIDRDFMNIDDDESKILSAEFNTAKERHDAAKTDLDAIKEKIIAKAETLGHPRVKMHNLSVVNVRKAGSIDYKAVPDLEGIDLNKYRKADSNYWKITKARP